MSIIPTGEEMAAMADDAARYRWLRRRLQIRSEQYMDGKFHKSFNLRVGCARVDMSRDAGESYLSSERFEEECAELDATIDAAIAANPKTS